MMRMRVVRHATGTAAVRSAFSGSFAASRARHSPLSAKSDAHNIEPSLVQPRYFDPYTWPIDWKAEDIKKLLCTHLVNPVVFPDFEVLASFLHESNIDALEDELKGYFQPSPAPTFREEAENTFKTLFPTLAFPTSTEEVDAFILYLYYRWYPNAPPAKYSDGRTQVLSRSDTYKDTLWYQPEMDLPPGIDAIRKLTDEKLRCEKLLLSLVLLFDRSANFKELCVCFGVPCAANIVPSMISFKGATTLKNYNFRQTSRAPQQHDIKGAANLDAALQAMPVCSSDLFPAHEANVHTFVNTSEYFSDLHQRLKTLSEGDQNRKRVLYMMGWMFSWDMRLVPSVADSTLRYHVTNLKKCNTEIRILYWKWTNYKWLDLDVGNDLTLTRLALQDMELTKGVDYMDHCIQGSMLAPSVYSHDQNHVTILDGSDLTAYCGSTDIAVGRYDDDEKVVFHNPLSDGCRFETSLRFGGTRNDGSKFTNLDFKSGEPRLPWHDVQARICGPAALEIAQTFEHFFTLALSQQKITLPGPKLSRAEIVANPKSNAIVQILHARDPEFAFEEAMLQLINAATNTIYIEGHTFYGRLDFDDTSRNVLKNRVPLALVKQILNVKRADFRVRVVLPLILDCYFTLKKNSIAEHILNAHHQTRESMKAHIKHECESHPEKYPEDLNQCLEFYYLGQDINGRTYPTYLHSKVMIVDSKVCVIGSASISDRSMLPNRDTNAAAIINSTEVATELQGRLDKQHKKFLKPFPADPNIVVGFNDKEINVRGRKSGLIDLFPQLL